MWIKLIGAITTVYVIRKTTSMLEELIVTIALYMKRVTEKIIVDIAEDLLDGAPQPQSIQQEQQEFELKSDKWKIEIDKCFPSRTVS